MTRTRRSHSTVTFSTRVLATAALTALAISAGTIGSAHAGANACSSTPLPGCRGPAEPGRASLAIKDRGGDVRDLVVWRYPNGLATTKGEFANPVAGTDYMLCLYDDTGLLTETQLPGASFCVDRPCWRDRLSGFRYRDPAGSSGGVVRATLAEGATDGDTEIILRAIGSEVEIPAVMPLTPPVTIQLVNTSNGVCWESFFSAPAKRNTATRYEDRAD